MLRFIAQRLVVTALVSPSPAWWRSRSYTSQATRRSRWRARMPRRPMSMRSVAATASTGRSPNSSHVVSRFVAGDFGRSHYLKLGVGEVLPSTCGSPRRSACSHSPSRWRCRFRSACSRRCGPNTMIDRVALSIAVAGQALPSFLFALGLIYLFGVILRWLRCRAMPLAAFHPAGRGARLLRHARDHAPHAFRHDRGVAVGSRAHGARLRSVALERRGPSWIAPCHHSGGLARRRPARLHARRLDRDRDRVLYAALAIWPGNRSSAPTSR